MSGNATHVGLEFYAALSHDSGDLGADRDLHFHPVQPPVTPKLHGARPHSALRFVQHFPVRVLPATARLPRDGLNLPRGTRWIPAPGPGEWKTPKMVSGPLRERGSHPVPTTTGSLGFALPSVLSLFLAPGLVTSGLDTYSLISGLPRSLRLVGSFGRHRHLLGREASGSLDLYRQGHPGRYDIFVLDILRDHILRLQQAQAQAFSPRAGLTVGVKGDSTGTSPRLVSPGNSAAQWSV